MNNTSENDSIYKYFPIVIIIVFSTAILFYMLAIILPINYRENLRLAVDLIFGAWEGFLFILIAIIFSFKKKYTKALIMCIISLIGISFNIIVLFLGNVFYDDFVNSINLLLITIDLCFVNLPLLVIARHLSKTPEIMVVVEKEKENINSCESI